MTKYDDESVYFILSMMFYWLRQVRPSLRFGMRRNRKSRNGWPGGHMTVSGMFIHWGLVYALPARHEWVMRYEKIPVEDYEKYFDLFDGFV